jgi:class 3 adenylate cyclase
LANPPALGGAGHAERKLVTVLLADVEEAAGAWSEPDPEDVERAQAGHAARIHEQVRRFGGVVEHQIAGRTLAVFGLPRTRDDDPARAVLAALAIRDALGGPASATRPRLVVATGRALVRLSGEVPGGQRVLGDPIAICARLLEVTPPGAVLVTEPTARPPSVPSPTDRQAWSPSEVASRRRCGARCRSPRRRDRAASRRWWPARPSWPCRARRLGRAARPPPPPR